MKNYVILLAVTLAACQPSKKNYTWDEFAIDGEPSLRGISVLDKNVIWVSGTNGTVVKTENGGVDWHEVYVPKSDSLDFRDVEVLSKTDVVLMSAGPGGKSNVFKTKDGGHHWQTVLINEYDSGFFDGMAFWNENEGILGGDPVEGKLFLMKTEDGGDSWRQIHPDHLPEINEGEIGGFAASGSHLSVKGNSAWVGTGAATARVFYTHDKGQHWEVVYTPIVQGESSTGIFSVDFLDEKNGVAVGGDYTKEDEVTEGVIVTKDGSQTWQLASNFPVYQSAVRYLSKKELISVGPSGCYRSSDKGMTWEPFGDSGFHTLAVAKDGTVWAAGRAGRIAQLIIK
ncbi:oxidoreductase [Reichenbachiella carrageenanivorans]|uniref:Oxidoreductase n=1 Tax=Reichenbachiella carrageenanivorans TaxID=2979869 RepID=A0ABY6D301_9BACT|nr:oxidoreductase [Reichenbachiella carrageenanivorans]UXX80531.1 oxidoreductase [Reichenbachiella carrageenanivorans]